MWKMMMKIKWGIYTHIFFTYYNILAYPISSPTFVYLYAYLQIFFVFDWKSVSGWVAVYTLTQVIPLVYTCVFEKWLIWQQHLCRWWWWWQGWYLSRAYKKINNIAFPVPIIQISKSGGTIEVPDSLLSLVRDAMKTTLIFSAKGVQPRR